MNEVTAPYIWIVHRIDSAIAEAIYLMARALLQPHHILEAIERVPHVAASALCLR